MTVKEGLFIGELSRQAGISVQTIRYYERLGLACTTERTEAQYRIYSADAEERLRFIQKAKRFGLSLDEIKRLIEISAKGVPPCANLKTISMHGFQKDRPCRAMPYMAAESVE
jgi:DNA-binding transcriptional MerR regulator